MTTYAATFFTHYDAVLFAQKLATQGIAARCCPVPRALSSSCGTAVRFDYDSDINQWFLPLVEQICRFENDKWLIIYDNK